MTLTRFRIAARSVCALALGGAAAAVCGAGPGDGAAARGTPGSPRAPIVIDGKMGDWPEGVAALADERYVYVRFRIEPGPDGMPQAIQASDETLTLRLDLDGNPATGHRFRPDEGAEPLGVELRIAFSPRTDRGVGSGASVTAYDEVGESRRISHADADVLVAPTHASEWYEARIARAPAVEWAGPGEQASAARPEPDLLTAPDTSVPTPVLGSIPLLSELFREDGAWRRVRATGRGAITLTDAAGERITSSGGFEFRTPADVVESRRSDAPVPSTPATRVVSWNVRRGAPMDEPGPFARVLRSLEPDVVLVQEWDGVEASGLASWFEEHVGGSWNAASRPELGVGIASRGEILSADTGDDVPGAGEQADEAGEPGEARPVRYVAAVVRTAWRDTAVASMHFKCCGSAGSNEDRRRLAEARAVNRAFERLATEPGMTRVIGGDLNLVGLREPIERLGAGLDADGSELAIADTGVLGDNAIYTWRNPESSFTPGRLDYLLWSDANTEVRGAFVLDAARLSDAALEESGLERGDSEASDHLPVVLDLRPRISSGEQRNGSAGASRKNKANKEPSKADQAAGEASGKGAANEPDESDESDESDEPDESDSGEDSAREFGPEK